jgi:hypothetical protein
MKLHFKAAVLSAFVLPGLGQIYKGDRVKGGIVIGLVNLFLLAALFLVMKGMGVLIVTARLSGMEAAARVVDGLKEKGPAVRLILAAFFVLWVYSAVDALLKHETAAGQKDNGNMV